MTEELAKVAPLTKVSLSLAAGRAADRMDLTPDPLPLTFVCGIGKEGLTPFECELSEAPAGESVSFSVPRHQLDSFFEHIFLPLPALDHVETIHFNVRVERVSAPSSREVIKAMAEAAEGCSCGCGCGWHGSSVQGCDGEHCGGHI